jgi:hypothetical protein
MAFTYSRLTEISQIAASAASVYANPSSKTTYIRSITLHNANSSAETVVLYNVPDSSGSAGTAAIGNQFYKASVAAESTVIIEFATPGIILEDTNDTIQASTTTANKVTIQIMGATE